MFPAERHRQPVCRPEMLSASPTTARLLPSGRQAAIPGGAGCFQMPARTCTLRTQASPVPPPGPRVPGSMPSVGRDETPDQALERRLRESKRYEERVISVQHVDEWERQMKAAGNNLLVVEVQGESMCEFGTETPEYNWKDEARQAQLEAMQTCNEIKHTFQRVARDCADATFLSITVDDEPTPEISHLCDKLGIDVLPTLQFWRNGAKLWEHKGALHMDADLAEGVLFYDGSMAGGAQASDFIQEITTKQQLQAFLNGGDEKVLKVVYMALSTASPCIHIYPAVLALAKNFVGFAAFSRVVGDQTPETAMMLREHNIVEVPTFIFFRGGQEVGRHVGSSRADLIGQILQIQQDLGISPPPRPTSGTVPRRKPRPVW